MADDDKTKTQNTDGFTKLDPENLSDELKEIYKSMQADYTRKTQELAEKRKEFTEKESSWEDKLKSFGAIENEVKQWRDWYKQLEEQAIGGDKQAQTLPNVGDLADVTDNDDPNAKLTGVIKTLEQQIKDLEGELTSIHGSLKDSRDQTNRMFNYQAQLALRVKSGLGVVFSESSS